ncbi:DoxX family protein [Actinokineospora sp. UTMC 2448]|uniref:DoxX family protein n=1 Tax=Actinokineospora sp. UTMC 2448 TaxID=2268449 RepID=UPI0021644A55|nr:DoxX family protein [Actinokineospora sp. UTMC 2448]UVS79938.1 DoxX [Actinokineospora sp. UTMC 2448]
MILRRIARPMLAGIFVWGGVQALRAPEAHAEAAKPLLDQATAKAGDRVPQQLATDPVTLVKIDGAVKVVAGIMLATNRMPRLAALLLSGSLVPTTLAAHQFWAEKDPGQRNQQLQHFLKNAGLLGGLMLAVADTEGRPSLGWRARRAGRTVQNHMHDLGEWAHDTGGAVGGAVAAAPRRARKALADVLP